LEREDEEAAAAAAAAGELVYVWRRRNYDFEGLFLFLRVDYRKLAVEMMTASQVALL